jgi:hypothetical protein
MKIRLGCVIASGDKFLGEPFSSRLSISERVKQQISWRERKIAELLESLPETLADRASTNPSAGKGPHADRMCPPA